MEQRVRLAVDALKEDVDQARGQPRVDGCGREPGSGWGRRRYRWGLLGLERCRRRCRSSLLAGGCRPRSRAAGAAAICSRRRVLGSTAAILLAQALLEAVDALEELLEHLGLWPPLLGYRI